MHTDTDIIYIHNNNSDYCGNVAKVHVAILFYLFHISMAENHNGVTHKNNISSYRLRNTLIMRFRNC